MTPDDFWDAVDRSGECWIWTRAIDAYGYGAVWFEGKTQKAHRVAWFLTFGTWPELTLDHVRERCDSRACCNPTHLEDVTQGENVRRALQDGTCRRGHPLQGDNVVQLPRGRTCRVCRDRRMAKYRRNLSTQPG